MIEETKKWNYANEQIIILLVCINTNAQVVFLLAQWKSISTAVKFYLSVYFSYFAIEINI